ncbi:Neuronal PAS [Homalodisca vitripennis]|nr:Neuronal PAS [Homalodisca vitripennis]
MRANSWLYHYYMVQSKLQYGLAYDTHPTTRMSTPYYQQPQPYQDSPPVATYHQMSPSQLPAPPHLHPQVKYSVLKEVQNHLADVFRTSTDGLLQATLPHTPEPVFRYGRRTEPEPVDYSLHSAQPEMPQRSPHLKQEPQVDLSPSASPCSEAVDREGGASVLMASSTASLGRSRLLVKAATTVVDPHDFMDQWNPSPPWSDTTVQKVPDIIHQDLSPYVTTTPPTPVSLQHTPHSAFSFDWTPEQFVPQVQGSQHLADEEHCPHLSWPSEHRLFPLQPPPAGSRPALVLRLESDPMDQSQHKGIYALRGSHGTATASRSLPPLLVVVTFRHSEGVS